MPKGIKQYPVPDVIETAAGTLVEMTTNGRLVPRPPLDRIPQNPSTLGLLGPIVLPFFLDQIVKAYPSRGRAIRWTMADLAVLEAVERAKPEYRGIGLLGTPTPTGRDRRRRQLVEQIGRFVRGEGLPGHRHRPETVRQQRTMLHRFLQKKSFPWPQRKQSPAARTPLVDAWLKAHWDALWPYAFAAPWCCDYQIPLGNLSNQLAKAKSRGAVPSAILAHWHGVKGIKNLLEPS